MTATQIRKQEHDAYWQKHDEQTHDTVSVKQQPTVDYNPGWAEELIISARMAEFGFMPRYQKVCSTKFRVARLEKGPTRPLNSED